MVAKTKKPKLVLAPKDLDLKELNKNLDKMVKSFTKEVKSEAEKYGIIIDIKIAMSAADSTQS